MTFPELIHFLISETTRFLTPIGIAAEWVLVLVGAAVIFCAPLFGDRFLATFRDRFRRLANRRRTAILICAILPVAIRVSMLGFAPVPEPSIHDEFSHLLLADTLAHARLTNPTPPLWQHFESIHIIQRPTYNSMYPPAQGCFLALGEVLFHEPWAGVEISVALMFAVMCWMMQGWMAAEWAFYGTLIAILKIGIVGFWVNSYMGGSVPAIGGALVLGAVPRLRAESARASQALLFGIGTVILMNSRPFEGAVLVTAALLYMSPALFRKLKRDRRWTLRAIVYPATAIVLCGVAFTCYYSWRVTGNPLRMPYQVNRDTYGWPENLAFLAPKKISFRHPVLRDMYELEIHHHDIYKTPETFLDNLVVRVFDNWAYLIGPVLTLPLVFALFSDNRLIRPLIGFALVIAFLNVFQMLLYPYHLGPIISVIFALVAAGATRMYRAIFRTAPLRASYFAILLPVALILVGAMKQEGHELNIPESSYWERGYELHRDARASIAAWLENQPGKQLVIVQYAPGHPVNQEWVYNGADIKGSKILWARDMDEASDAQLLRYFSDRHAWLLQADVYPQRVIPYPEVARADSTSSGACGRCRNASAR